MSLSRQPAGDAGDGMDAARGSAQAPAADQRVAIFGLGYVGLPLGLALAEAGLSVVGIDADERRLATLNSGRSVVDGIPDARLAEALADRLRLVSPANADLRAVDVVFVCVPTPVNDAMEPDLTAVLAAADAIAGSLRHGQLVVLQSTTYPGTTNGPFREHLEASGLTAGEEFGLAFAPERINPGDPPERQANLPRLVGGLTRSDTARAAALFRRMGSEVFELSSPDAAEMAKLHENVFRNVNIALVNQLALLCERMGLDVWEVVDAAATKPFGFMAFRPGPGVGGHCIPVDPYYLSWRARQFGINDRFVELAGDINAAMPVHVADLVGEALNERGRSTNGARIGVIGVSFKPNVSDTRNSPAATVIGLLRRRGGLVSYHDPHVSRFTDEDGTISESVPLEDLVAGSDLVIAQVAHRQVDWSLVYARAQMVVDAVGSSRSFAVAPRQVLRLGGGWS